jgi:predicted RNase H-like nuclease
VLELAERERREFEDSLPLEEEKIRRLMKRNPELEYPRSREWAIEEIRKMYKIRIDLLEKILKYSK